jgi:hypothetical protein
MGEQPDPHQPQRHHGRNGEQPAGMAVEPRGGRVVGHVKQHDDDRYQPGTHPEGQGERPVLGAVAAAGDLLALGIARPHQLAMTLGDGERKEEGERERQQPRRRVELEQQGPHHDAQREHHPDEEDIEQGDPLDTARIAERQHEIDEAGEGEWRREHERGRERRQDHRRR